MVEPQPRFKSELRMSAWPAALAVMGASLFILWYTEPHPVLMPLAVVAAICLGLDFWQPWLAKWLLILALVAALVFSEIWLDIPGLVALLFVPTALAAALMSLSTAATVAAVESMLLLTLTFPPSGLARQALIPASQTLIALTGIWAASGIMYLVYRPIYSFVDWAEHYYERVQALLAEAQERKVALEQALGDLTLVSRELALTNERLAALRDIAEEAQQTKAAFVAKVSHEFRTPLNMIIGLVDLMVKSPEVYGKKLPRAILEDLAIVQRNCQHLAGLINDVLDLSQVEAGRVTLHRERVQLAEVNEEALVVVRPLLVKKGLGLVVSVPGDLPEVYCDRTRVRQVILNLLSNAARFTDEGQITVEMAQAGGSVAVSVRDTGPGIPPEDIGRIFEPFCQGTRPMWRNTGGSGLGLSISRQFVELHGGRIWLDSELGTGTTFHFDLPISQEIEPAGRTTRWLNEDWVWHARNRPAQIPNLAARPRVLVCDEGGDLRALLARYAGETEIELVEAENVRQAAEIAKAGPAHLAILNASSPDLLWPLLHIARSTLPGTPIVGCVVPSHLRRIVDAHVLDYLVKPVTQADLQRTLAKAQCHKRMLLIDDNAEVVMLWTRMLRLLDDELEVESASCGKAGLAAMRRGSFDLVLLDIVLPDINGWQVLTEKNEDVDIAGIPVVLISAEDPMDEPARSEALLVTMDKGLSIGKLLRGAVATSAIMLGPD